MDLSFLPNDIFSSILSLNVDKLTEIRIRQGYPVLVNYCGKMQNIDNNQIIATKNHIQYIIDSVTERSIYAFNSSIKQGFLTTSEGIRIGLSGECVFENNDIVTIKNFTSLNIRIPHLIEDCSNKVIQYILEKKKVLNSLILSPPGKGKTTILKDLILKFNYYKCGQILVIDERNEFSLISGEYIDRIVYSNKKYAFNYALRSMSPEIVVTDELSCKNDWQFVKNAINSGVKLIASCHASTINELKNKDYFINKIFDRYIVLKNINIPGVIDCVYDKNFNVI